MYEFSRFQTGNLCKHHCQHCILHDIPVVGSQHILRTLVQNRIEFLPADIESHGISTGIESHFAEICKIIDVCHDSAGRRIVFQIPEDLVHLIHISFGIVVFYPKLIAVCFSNGAVLICPGIPYTGTKIMHVIALFLPDPQKLVNGGLPVRPADCENRKFIRKIVTVDDTETFYCMGRRTVLPAGPDGKIRIPRAVIQYLPAILNENFVCSAHTILHKSF